MNTKHIKISFTILISTSLSFLVILLCYFLAEKYFFDKFFYYKSTAHGYYVSSDEDQGLEKYGNRAKDIIALTSYNSNVLGTTTDKNKYNIAIVGDSFVWGQGIRNNQRFAVLLEKKLNEIRPTKVYSLGNNGDNVFDNYQKYLESIKVFGPMDAYIFGFYNNDLVFNPDDRYQTNEFINKNLSIGCSGNRVFDPEFDADKTDDYAFYQAKLTSLKEGSINLCAFNKLVPMLPKENTIYFDLNSIEVDHEVKLEFSKVISKNLPVIGLQLEDYTKTKVSPKEGHPSAYANQLYADLLFREITTNPLYKFNEQLKN